MSANHNSYGAKRQAVVRRINREQEAYAASILFQAPQKPVESFLVPEGSFMKYVEQWFKENKAND